MQRVSTRDDLLSALQTIITDLLPCGYPAISSAAARIGISVRTLQRKLAEAGVNYGELVEHIRFDQACLALQNPGVHLREISTRLGYRDPSSFSRAFARWAGMAPRQYRQRLTGSAECSSGTRIGTTIDL